MLRARALTFAAALVPLALSIAWLGTDSAPSRSAEERPEEAGRQAIHDASGLPFYFVEAFDGGPASALYQTRLGDGSAWFARDTIVVSRGVAAAGDKPASYALRFPGARPDVELEASGQLRGRVHYLGPDEQSTRRGLRTFSRLTWRDLHPGIDLEVHGRGRRLEYDFVVAPRADPELLRLRFEGVDELEVAESGELHIRSGSAAFMHERPEAFQHLPGGEREHVESRFVLGDDNTVLLAVADYDRDRELVVDPVALAYASYLGGGLSDQVNDVAVGEDGSIYLAGISKADLAFPVTEGAFQENERDCNGWWGPVGFFTKLGPGGAELLWSTVFHNPVEPCERGIEILGVDVGPEGNLYYVGKSPGVGIKTTAGAFQTNPNLNIRDDADGFTGKLAADGASLLYSTWLTCTSSRDDHDRLIDVAVDAEGHAYVVGRSLCQSMPITSGAYQKDHASYDWRYTSYYDTYVAKLEKDGSDVLAATFYGGSYDEYSTGMVLDPQGDVLITGSTKGRKGSGVYPPTTSGAFQESYGGGDRDAFVARFNPELTELLSATFFGGGETSPDDPDTWTGRDIPYGLALNSQGQVVVTGYTYATDLPTTEGAWDRGYGGRGDSFLAVFSQDLSELVYGTYLGGSADERYQNLVAVAPDDTIWLAGSTRSPDFPLTDNAWQSAHAGGMDVFVSALKVGEPELVYSTFLGGAGNDRPYAAARLPGGGVAVTGATWSEDFPTTAGAFDVDGVHTPDGGDPVPEGFVFLISDLPAGDFAVTKQVKDGLSEMRAGESVTFVVEVTNNGPDDLLDAKLVDTPGPGAIGTLDFDAAAGDECVWSAGQITCTLHNLAIGQARQVLVTVTTRREFEGELTNHARVQPLGALDPEGDNDEAEASIKVVRLPPDLYVDKSGAGQVPPSGGRCTHTIDWGNKGEGDATGVVLEDRLPAGTVFVEATGDHSYDETEHLVRWHIGAAAPAASGSVEVSFQIPAGVGADGQSFSDTASIASTDAEAETAGDNTDTAACTVWDPALHPASVSFVKNAGVLDVELDEVIEYEIKIENDGEQAYEAGVVDEIPDGTEYEAGTATADRGHVSVSDGTLAWDSAGELEVGASATIRYSVRVTACRAAAGGRIVNRAQLTVEGHPGLSREDRVELKVMCPDLEVEASFRDYVHGFPPVDSHGELGLITVTNNGEGRSMPTVLVLESKHHVLDEGTEADRFIGLQRCEWDLPALPPGESETRSATVIAVNMADVMGEGRSVELDSRVEHARQDVDLDTANDSHGTWIDKVTLDLERKRTRAALVYTFGGAYYDHDYMLRYRYKSTSTLPVHLASFDIVEKYEDIGVNHEDEDFYYEHSPVLDTVERSEDPLLLKHGPARYPALTVNDGGFVRTGLRNRASRFTPGGTYSTTDVDRLEPLDYDNDDLVGTYENDWQVEITAPTITKPGDGEICLDDTTIRIEGLAFPGAEVHILLEGLPCPTEPDAQPAEAATFDPVVTTAKQDGTFLVDWKNSVACEHLELEARLFVDGAYGPPSKRVKLRAVEGRPAWCPQVSDWMHLDSEPRLRTYRFKDKKGQFSKDDWQIERLDRDGESFIHICLCEQVCDHFQGLMTYKDANGEDQVVMVEKSEPKSVWLDIDGRRIDRMVDDGSFPVGDDDTSCTGEYADFHHRGPAHKMSVNVECCPADPAVEQLVGCDTSRSKAGPVLIDPDGYVFDTTRGLVDEALIPGAKATCMWLDEANNAWVQWPAHMFEDQVNPQITGEDGYFAFFTPPGFYYIDIEGPEGWQRWRSPVVQVISEIVHVNVPYTPVYEAADMSLTVSPAGIEDDQGADAARLSVDAGAIVEWRSFSGAELSDEEISAHLNSPKMRILSSLDPLEEPAGFDSGVVSLGASFRHRFDTPGVYAYSTGLGPSGAVVVAGEPEDAEDTDGDGVLDRAESGPGGDDPAFDGDGDGTPDREQASVVSLSARDGGFVTVVATGATITSAAHAPLYRASRPPEGVTFPWGTFELLLDPAAVGDPITLAFILPEGAEADTFHRLGRLDGEGQAQAWVALPGEAEATPGATVEPARVTLRLLDGGAGDEGLVDGEILVRGGPARVGYTLQVHARGEGRVVSEDGRLDCGDTCRVDVPAGTTVKLLAEETNLVAWTGCDEVAGFECSLLPESSRDVTAVLDLDEASFAPESSTITLGLAEGTTELGATVRLTNRSDLDVRVSAVEVRGAARLVSETCTETELPAAGGCDVSLAADPGATDDLGVLEVASNAPDAAWLVVSLLKADDVTPPPDAAAPDAGAPDAGSDPGEPGSDEGPASTDPGAEQQDPGTTDTGKAGKVDADVGELPETEPADDEGGCSCRLAPSSPSPRLGAPALLLLAALWWLRRRRTSVEMGARASTM